MNNPRRRHKPGLDWHCEERSDEAISMNEPVE
jgi:hypothetical protein